MTPIPFPRCGAINRAGQPCTRRPPSGQHRCHLHGGAPGSGAPPGNANALKHGFYAERIRDFAADILAAGDAPLQLRDEIALLRAVLARAAAVAEPKVVALIVGTLVRLINAQHKLDLAAPRELPPLDPEEEAELEALAAALNAKLLEEGEW